MSYSSLHYKDHFHLWSGPASALWSVRPLLLDFSFKSFRLLHGPAQGHQVGIGTVGLHLKDGEISQNTVKQSQ